MKPIACSHINWGEPHTSESDGTSDRLRTITIKHRNFRTITIKHGHLINSSLNNLNYTKNSQNGFNNNIM